MKYTITIKGHWHKYSFEVTGTEKDAAQWRREGFEVHRLLNTVPEWVEVYFGYPGIYLWCKAQDILGVYK